MTRAAASRTPSRTSGWATAVGIATAAIVGTLVYQSASSALPSSEGGSAFPAGPSDEGASSSALPPGGGAPASLPPGEIPREDGGAVDAADGSLPDGVTVFDDTYRGVTNLDPGLLDALREAATAAAHDGIDVYINSGWRSAEYQDRLLREAVSTYGSEAEAARWVATADTSPHVSGHAVDIGPLDATLWLSEHGAAYGLCQIYGNESWHYELRPEAIDHDCPPMYADPTQDPRMRH